MSEIILTCFIQGLDKEFSVFVDETEITTIKELKELIIFRKKRAIVENNIDINNFEIWKVSVPIKDDTSIKKLRKTPAEIKDGVKLEDEEELQTILGNNFDSNYIHVFMGNSMKIIHTCAPEKEIKNLINDLSLQISKQGEELTNLFHQYRKTKFVKKGEELREMCIIGVMRVNDELHFKKVYDTLAGIQIERKFKVLAVNETTFVPTVENIDDKSGIHMELYSLTLLEEEIIKQDVKQEMRNQLTQNRDTYINKLQEYNQKNNTTNRLSRLNVVLQNGDDLDKIYEVQRAKLHSEGSFTIHIPNTMINLIISDFIDRYFRV